AILAGRADIGIHSLKDLPTVPHPSLFLPAIPPREDPRDALVSRGDLSLARLPHGAVIGTGSPRRAAQLLVFRPDLRIADIRGNVDTRLGKVASGQCDATILACAGLARLGLSGVISEAIEVDVMMPAPGQGALAIEAATDVPQRDPELFAALSELDDPHTHACVTAERALLNTLEAGCSAPVGALATISQSGSSRPTMTLNAVAASVDGQQVFRMSTTGFVDEASILGSRLAHELLAAGAAGLLGESP
ncbi:MAG: hydroxymethylbilane synthase, partial [Actinomycetes bacterium]